MSQFMNMHVNPLPPKTPEVKYLNVAEGLEYFKTMFPNIENDVIESVLRANHGCVDESVDQLLVLAKDAEKEKKRNFQSSSTA